MPAAYYIAPGGPTTQKSLLTITAPADAPVGTTAPFRVVGRAENNGQALQREAQPETLYGSSHNDRMPLRFSPRAYAVVAPPLDCRLETPVKELTVALGGTVQIPVKVRRQPGVREIGIPVDGETPAAGTAWRTPLSLKAGEAEVALPMTVSGR